MKKPLQILFAALNDGNIHELGSDLSELDFIQVVIVMSPNQLRNVLTDYAEMGRDATVWIHVEKHNLSNAEEIPRNFKIIEKLRRENVISRKAKIYFLTSGNINNIKGVHSVSNVKAEFKDLEIFSQNVFIGNNHHLLPKPQNIEKILAHRYHVISNFHYPKSAWFRPVIEFKQEISDKKMSAILGELFFDLSKEDSSNIEYLVDVINSGYSGAKVLKVSRFQNGEQSDFLLKMAKDEKDLENEFKQAKFLALKKLHPPVFIGTYPFTKKLVYNWHCLLFEYATDKKTLQEWLKEKLKNSSKKNKVIEKIKQSWEPFEIAFKGNKRLKKGLNPYLGEDKIDNQNKFKRLKLSKLKEGDIFQTLKSLSKQYSNFKKHTFFELNDFKHFKKFISNENGDFDGINIARYSNEGTPLFYGHGDFHGGNILISECGMEISFIDFANSQNNLHGFSDWGKLSSDLEISVMPEIELIDNLPQLYLWIETHKEWLYGKETKSNLSLFQKIYTWNTDILNHIKELGISYGLSEEETIRQFHIVRLHYFLKALSYDHECREKLVFFLSASIDILKFLTQPSKS